MQELGTSRPPKPARVKLDGTLAGQTESEEDGPAEGESSSEPAPPGGLGLKQRVKGGGGAASPESPLAAAAEGDGEDFKEEGGEDRRRTHAKLYEEEAALVKQLENEDLSDEDRAQLAAQLAEVQQQAKAPQEPCLQRWQAAINAKLTEHWVKGPRAWWGKAVAHPKYQQFAHSAVYHTLFVPAPTPPWPGLHARAGDSALSNRLFEPGDGRCDMP